jgi:MYXO-CTERM domain-containing protein
MTGRIFLGSFGFCLLLAACNAKPARAQLESPFDDTLAVDQAYVTGADGATDIAFHPDGRAVITQKGGTISVRAADGSITETTGEFDDLDTSSEKGLLGVAADPSVATNDTFYFYADTGPNDDKHRVYKGVLNDDDTVTVDTANPIVAAARNVGPGLEGPANHDGGGLFIHDNQLYIGVGDTGANSSPPTNKYGSCLNKGNGKILRVNLDGSVPSDNPLASVTEVTACDSTRGDWTTAAPDRRIFAWGFRNPWRFWIDPHTDLLWVGDVGEVTREEIAIVRSGEHHGYPFWEGMLDHSMANGQLRLDKTCDQDFLPSRPCTPAVHDYDHGEGTSVTGGLIPEGCGWLNAFAGKLYYLFADYGSSWMHALEVKPDRSGVVSSTAIEFGAFTGGPSSIRQGPDGGVYVVFYGGGNVTRLTPAAATGSDCSGAGGSGGSGGTAGAGGASGSGGTAGTGGASGSGGSGGSAGRGGTAGSGGAPLYGGRPGEKSGCGCRVSGTGARGAALFVLGLGVVFAARRRRRRS